jgi:hypothetical protein
MRTSEILASIAVAGSVAAFAMFNMNALPSADSFLQAPQDEVTLAFNHYLAKYGKNYGTKEDYNKRLEVFKNNYHIIMHHNMMNREDEGFAMAITQFADMSSAEFKTFNGYKPHLKKTSNVVKIETNGALPASVDWRTVGAVTPVKN